ncbi:DNA repair protein RAD51 homolog 3-like isoform X2 [Physella acuta]|uniref:DNA repair protein RAD51 homolog 3-like isoform X2 n=1 Tax=Physella acuta TaxID=109671 RepID=UPI0027DD3C44|nr:DNA repair protein RAD51 homolog 3-like isoform X2 [Physella acuta]
MKKLTMSSRREINTFPISHAVLNKLSNVGLWTVEDFATMKPSELSLEANITQAEALEVLQTLFIDVNATVRKQNVPIVKTALDVFREEQDMTSIITFCEKMDDMLGGGVPLHKITEFCGAPGIGKTQICLQLAVDAHIPEHLGGLDGEVVYIDTEGSFIVERMVDIATATVEHCHQIGNQGSNEQRLTVNKVLAGTHYFRCIDHVQLIATIHMLPKFLTQHSKVKLVIVDSIASPFRNELDDMSLRTKLLSSLAQNFIKIASDFNVAVVFTNQMTTKILPGEGNSHLIPALGENWGHASTMRVILYWENNQRRALLYKSPSKQETVCSFQITLGGIRDIQENESSSGVDQIQGERANTDNLDQNNYLPSTTPPTKRQRT